MDRDGEADKRMRRNGYNYEELARQILEEARSSLMFAQSLSLNPYRQIPKSYK